MLNVQKPRWNMRRGSLFHVTCQFASSATKPDPQDLLDWYDRHRRELPWRAKPAETATLTGGAIFRDQQQTTVAAVKPYYLNFLARFPTVDALAEAPSDAVMHAWAGLGYYSRARNLHACAKAVVENMMHFPSTKPNS